MTPTEEERVAAIRLMALTLLLCVAVLALCFLLGSLL